MSKKETLTSVPLRVKLSKDDKGKRYFVFPPESDKKYFIPERVKTRAGKIKWVQEKWLKLVAHKSKKETGVKAAVAKSAKAARARAGRPPAAGKQGFYPPMTPNGQPIQPVSVHVPFGPVSNPPAIQGQINQQRENQQLLEYEQKIRPPLPPPPVVPLIGGEEEKKERQVVPRPRPNNERLAQMGVPTPQQLFPDYGAYPFDLAPVGEYKHAMTLGKQFYYYMPYEDDWADREIRFSYFVRLLPEEKQQLEFLDKMAEKSNFRFDPPPPGWEEKDVIDEMLQQALTKMPHGRETFDTYLLNSPEHRQDFIDEMVTNIVETRRQLAASYDSYYGNQVVGQGRSSVDRGMSDQEIDRVMKKYPEFYGAISHNELDKVVAKVPEKSRGACIINTDPLSKPGEHWQALYWDARPNGEMSIDFFDSFGDKIDPKLMAGVKKLSEKLNAEGYLKFKENRVKWQDDRSSNCGWFCCQFLIDRFRGKPFHEASHYEQKSKVGEARVEKFKDQVTGGTGKVGFGYLPSWMRSTNPVEPDYRLVTQSGGGVMPLPPQQLPQMVQQPTPMPVAQPVSNEYFTDWPPKVRAVIASKGNQPITMITLCREPIQRVLDRVINLITAGQWDAAKAKYGYSDMFHLYVELVLADGSAWDIERNHIIEMYPAKQNGAERYQVPMTRPLTLGQLMDNVKNAVGASLFRYDAAENNCQVFIRDLLKSSGLLDSGMQAWIMQDAIGLLSDMDPAVRDIFGLVTDAAHQFERWRQGAGRHAG